MPPRLLGNIWVTFHQTTLPYHASWLDAIVNEYSLRYNIFGGLSLVRDRAFFGHQPTLNQRVVGSIPSQPTK